MGYHVDYGSVVTEDELDNEIYPLTAERCPRDLNPFMVIAKRAIGKLVVSHSVYHSMVSCPQERRLSLYLEASIDAKIKKRCSAINSAVKRTNKDNHIRILSHEESQYVTSVQAASKCINFMQNEPLKEIRRHKAKPLEDLRLRQQAEWEELHREGEEIRARNRAKVDKLRREIEKLEQEQVELDKIWPGDTAGKNTKQGECPTIMREHPRASKSEALKSNKPTNKEVTTVNKAHIIRPKPSSSADQHRLS